MKKSELRKIIREIIAEQGAGPRPLDPNLGSNMPLSRSAKSNNLKRTISQVPMSKRRELDEYLSSMSKDELLDFYTQAYNEAPSDMQSGAPSPDEFAVTMSRFPGGRIPPNYASRNMFVLGYLLFMLYSRIRGEWVDQL